MKAVRTIAGGGIEVADVPVPEPRGQQVLVRVAGAGLCHSDTAIAATPAHYGGGPFTLGHETAGWVESFGPDARGVRAGQPVVVHALWGCGQCPVCRRGEERFCPVTKPVSGGGLGEDGGIAEYMLVPSPRLLVDLGDLDPRGAGPLDDAALTPYRAVRRSLDVLTPGSTAVVAGIGGLGHCAIQILRALAPCRIVAVEPDPAKRDLALELGADEALDPAHDAAARIRDRAPDGAALVLDLYGGDATLALAAATVARGGTVMLVGAALGSLTYNLIALPFEATLTTSYGGEISELAQVVALAQAGRLRLHTLPVSLDEVPDAYRRLDDGQLGAGRAVAVPG